MKEIYNRIRLFLAIHVRSNHSYRNILIHLFTSDIKSLLSEGMRRCTKYQQAYCQTQDSFHIFVLLNNRGQR